jgi:hypothetical protein
MTFLPIVARELRVATRRRGTYWCRHVAAVGALVVCCVLLGDAQVWKPEHHQNPGRFAEAIVLGRLMSGFMASYLEWIGDGQGRICCTKLRVM